MKRVRAGVALWVGLATTACAPADAPPTDDVPMAVEAREAEPVVEVRPEGSGEWPAPEDSIPGTPWTRTDWEIFAATLREAQSRRLDTLPLGDAIAEMGALFLGTP